MKPLRSLLNAPATILAVVAGVLLLARPQLADETPGEPAGRVALANSSCAEEAPWLQFLGTKAGTEYRKYTPTESQSIFGYTMLYAPPNAVIDFAEDARDKIRHWGVKEKDIDNILFTHGHPDHFHAPTVLSFARDRWQTYSRKTRAFASETVYARLEQTRDKAEAGAFLTVTRVTVGDRINLAESLAVTVMPSNHWTAPTPIHFLIELHDKKILYAVDAAAGQDDYFAALKGHLLDAVIVDCTYLDREVDPSKSGHMNYKMVRQFMTELRDRDLATPSTRCYITHMVPVKYSQCAPVAREMDLLMAHDGLRIFFP